MPLYLMRLTWSTCEAAGKLDMILEGATGAINVTNWMLLVDLPVPKKEGQCQSMEKATNQKLDEQ